MYTAGSPAMDFHSAWDLALEEEKAFLEAWDQAEQQFKKRKSRRNRATSDPYLEVFLAWQLKVDFGLNKKPSPAYIFHLNRNFAHACARKNMSWQLFFQMCTIPIPSLYHPYTTLYRPPIPPYTNPYTTLYHPIPIPIPPYTALYHPIPPYTIPIPPYTTLYHPYTIPIPSPYRPLTNPYIAYLNICLYTYMYINIHIVLILYVNHSLSFFLSFFLSFSLPLLHLC